MAAATAAVLTLLAVAVGFAVASRNSGPSTAVPVNLPGQLKGPAPWPQNGAELRTRLSALQLPALKREGLRRHIHQHLDVFVEGKRVTVPAGIGIDPNLRFISPVHTHDTSGVIHIESPTIRRYTLGEFFAVWGVRFRGGCLAGYCGGNGRTLRVYVNGRPVVGDPASFPLAAHQEIVVAFGTPQQLPKPIPASWPFPSNL
jgi:hypothetical protein